jgi:cyanophycin synthetase
MSPAPVCYAGRDLLLAAIQDEAFDVAGDRRAPGRHGRAQAARPEHRLHRRSGNRQGPSHSGFIRLLATGNLVQLGYGARSRRIWTAETDRTSAIAEGISRDKDLTKTLLQILWRTGSRGAPGR